MTTFILNWRVSLIVFALLQLHSFQAISQTQFGESAKKEAAAAESTEEPDTIKTGLQGSINPLTDNIFAETGDELLDKSFPNSWPLFGSGIRMSVGGYVKADFIQDFDYIGDRYEFELGSIAVDGSPERAQGGVTTFHAKETRVNFDFRSKAKWKNGKEFPMRVFVEIDWFFDAPNQRLNTRLRQAFGVVGRILIGQTWTTSGDLSVVPGLIDFSGGDALYGGRVSQIRWQDNIGKQWKYALAIEEAGGQIYNPQNLQGDFRPRFPNFAAMVKWKGSKGSSVQLGGDVFPINWSGDNTLSNSTKPGYALTLMGRWVIDLKHYHDAFLFGGGYGEGQGHKLIALSWDGSASAVVTQSGLTLTPTWFAYAGYNHYWNKKLNSTISTNWAGNELTADHSQNVQTRAGSVHANLIWFPYPLVSVGGEYMWGVRGNNNGIEGRVSRLQLMAKFKFH